MQNKSLKVSASKKITFPTKQLHIRVSMSKVFLLPKIWKNCRALFSLAYLTQPQHTKPYQWNRGVSHSLPLPLHGACILLSGCPLGQKTGSSYTFCLGSTFWPQMAQVEPKIPISPYTNFFFNPL